MAGLVGQMLDRYRLVEQIGQGGMATVYRAVDTQSMQELAIKVLSPTIGGDRRFVLRFRREAGLVKRRLKHPNIVPVVDYGEVDGYVYLVMSFLKGETLHDYLVRGPLTQKQKVRWIGQVAEALAFAHENGVIHRDIKPSNIMITEKGDALLMDFGLAREIEGSNTLTGSMLMGTPAYVSPEQARGEKLDPRSDQYSLGVILYQIAAGRLPFEADAPMAMVMQHIQDPVPRPGRFDRELSEAEEKVIVKCLAKRRDDRFPTLVDLNNAYQAALAGRRLPQFDLPPPASTVTMARPEATLKLDTQIIAPEIPRRRVAWWILPALFVTVILAGVLAYPSLSGLLGISTPTSIPTSGVTPVATGFIVLGDNPTKVPVTDTPKPTAVPQVTSEDCPGIVLHYLGTDGNKANWRVHNDTMAPVKILQFKRINWSLTTNGYLQSILLGEEMIWEGQAVQGDLTIEGIGWVLGSSKAIPLLLEFQWPAGETGYALSLVIDAGCTLEGNW